VRERDVERGAVDEVPDVDVTVCSGGLPLSPPLVDQSGITCTAGLTVGSSCYESDSCHRRNDWPGLRYK
jgi:hypothetical protein